MKILLLGEYSNVHNTLSCGLRELGHEVVVVSNGDFWKNYPRDIDVARRMGKIGGLRLLAKIIRLLPQLKGFDIVQLINPMFLELKAERILPIYKYLRRHNKKVVLGAFGMDFFWVYVNTFLRPLRYSDFNIGDEIRSNADAIKEQNDWLGTKKEYLNRIIAAECDHIITGLYEYDVCYRRFYSKKTTFIPLPIQLPERQVKPTEGEKLKLFVGISKNRNEYKGTDIMLQAAKEVEAKYPDLMTIDVAEGLPYSEYEQRMNGADVILDQLYSYTPSMNPLLAMSKGIICVGGGEPENYEILNEKELRPIINVQPNIDSVKTELERLVVNRSQIVQLKRDSIEYVKRHHDYRKVAKQYEKVFSSLL